MSRTINCIINQQSLSSIEVFTPYLAYFLHSLYTANINILSQCDSIFATFLVQHAEYFFCRNILGKGHQVTFLFGSINDGTKDYFKRAVLFRIFEALHDDRQRYLAIFEGKKC